MGSSQLHKDVWIKLSKKSKEQSPKDPRWYNASDEEGVGDDQRGK